MRIAGGDEQAFAVVYDRHAAFVFSSVARFLGDRETASEVVQDAFVTLWGRARQFDAGTGSMLTWLLAIARHRAIDRLRAEARRPGRDAVRIDAETPDGDAVRELAAGGGTDPTAIASRRWVQSVVRTGIAELPEHEREVLLLGYALDLSQSQIAERLDWPIGTVKSRTRRALAQLRARIGNLPELHEPAVRDAFSMSQDR